ncbi:MAG: LysM peptidoglycan-binding domain-containing protein [Alicyclobacillaceae bacterium]|nr:LysM peptidoglycan-binding domain-containing protein [Alicyclobacillaceae bacterium]
MVVGLALTTLLTLCLGLLAEKNPDARASGQDRTVVVQEGDTLWGIAERFAGPDVDRRQWIFQVRRMNHLEDATIYPGMVLRIPAGS